MTKPPEVPLNTWNEGEVHVIVNGSACIFRSESSGASTRVYRSKSYAAVLSDISTKNVYGPSPFTNLSTDMGSRQPVQISRESRQNMQTRWGIDFSTSSK